MTGFTGVVWEARDPQRLSRDLHDGPGSKPLFEAGMSWAQVGLVLTELQDEMAAVLKHLDVGWQGTGNGEMIATLRKVQSWLVETTDMAKQNAVAAERQAVANVVALNSMPDPAEVQALTDLAQSLSHMAFPAGAVINGGIAKLEDSIHETKAQAARVMESYEIATVPAAHPWHPVAAPENLVVMHAAAGTQSRGAHAKANDSMPTVNGAGSQMMLAELVAMASAPPSARTETAKLVTRQDVTTRTGEVVVEDGSTVQAPVVAEESAIAPVARGLGAPGLAGVVPQHQSGALGDLHLATRADSAEVVPDTGDRVVAPPVLGTSEKPAAS